MNTLQKQQYDEAVVLIKDFFDNSEKCDLWMNTENPLLGKIKPIDMIKIGKGENLLSFIKTSISENYR